MATSTTELVLRFTGDRHQLQETIAAVRADLAGSSKSQLTTVQQTNKQIENEAKKQTQILTREEQQRARAAEQLQRQRSAALFQIWKKEQAELEKLRRAEERAASGQKPFSTSIDQLTQSIVTLQGPLGGFASRINSLQTQLGGLTTQATGAGAAIGGMAGPAAIAVVGIVATTVAVVGLGAKLFAAAKEAADFQGRLLDMSQQTGVAVETLSALEIAALRVGGGIDGIVQPLIVFQRNLEEAQDGSSKAAKTFKDLGVETLNTEDALRQTLQALARMPEGFHQTARAQELFGKGARVFLAILKETGGDIDALIEKLRDQGLVTAEQAKRADDFNDKLLLLEVSLRGLGTEAIPLIIDVLNDLEKTVKNNRDAFDLLKGAVQVTTFLFTKPLQGAILSASNAWKGHQFVVSQVTGVYNLLRTAILGVTETINALSIPGAGGSSGLDLLKEISRFGVPLQEKQDFSKIKGLFKEEPKKGTAREDPGVQLLQQLQKELRGLEDVTKAEEVAAQLLEKRFAKINPQIKEQVLLTARIIDQKRAQLDIEKHLKELEEKHERQRKAAIDNLNNFVAAQTEAIRELRGERKSAFDEVSSILAEMQAADVVIDEVSKSILFLNAGLIEAGANAERLKDALPLANIQLPETAEGGRVLSDEAIDKLGQIPEGLSLWEQTMGSLLDRMVEFSDFTSGAFIASINGIADALADGVGAWVLYGGSFAKAMRQSLAALAAKIAAEAVLQAALHAAYAIGSLAFGDFAAAGQHAIAAAKFAALAGGAALAGRALAGNSALSDRGSAFASPGGPGGRFAQAEPQPVNINRNNQQPMVLKVEVTRDEGSTVRAWLDNVKNNGEARQAMVNELVFAR